MSTHAETNIDPIAWLQGQKMEDTVLVMINQPVSDKKYFDLAWRACDHHVVLDGAANELIRFPEYLPDFIIGDLDSISPETVAHYKARSVPIFKEASQDQTDFGKAMHRAKKEWPSTRQILAFGALGGRVDHSMHSVLQLSAAQRDLQIRLLLHSPVNMTFLVNSKAIVHTDRKIAGPAVGICPILGSAHITTRGLQWDVENWETSFATQVSTSNYLQADEITVETTKPVMLTVEINRAGVEAALS